MAKLRDVRFLCPGGLQSETVTYLDIIMTKQLSNGSCHSILFKLIMAILRQESSEALRRRYWFYYAEIAFTFLFSWNNSWFLFHFPYFSQYTLLLSYFQYCQHMLDPSIPNSVMQFFPMDEQDNEDSDLEKVIRILVQKRFLLPFICLLFETGT